MTKSFLLASISMLVSFSAHAKQQCIELNGTYTRMSAGGASMSFRSVVDGDFRVYSVVGVTDGLIWGDGKLHPVPAGGSVTATCLKDSLKLAIVLPEQSSLDLTFEVIDEHGDLRLTQKGLTGPSSVILTKEETQIACKK